MTHTGNVNLIITFSCTLVNLLDNINVALFIVKEGILAKSGNAFALSNLFNLTLE